MIVVDASVVAELLLGLPAGPAAEEAVFAEEGGAHAPSLIDAEVLHTLRRYERGGRMTPERGREAVTDLIDLPITRYPLIPLIEAAWSLRRNLSAYDALYAALAQGIEANLVTTDGRMAAAVSAHTEIEVARIT